MNNLVLKLRERAESYRMGGPSSEHTASLLDQAALEIEVLTRELDKQHETLMRGDVPR